MKSNFVFCKVPFVGCHYKPQVLIRSDMKKTKIGHIINEKKEGKKTNGRTDEVSGYIYSGHLRSSHYL